MKATKKIMGQKENWVVVSNIFFIFTLKFRQDSQFLIYNTTVFLRWCETTNYRTFAWFCSWRWFFFNNSHHKKKSTEKIKGKLPEMRGLIQMKVFPLRMGLFSGPFTRPWLPYPGGWADGPLQGEDAQCGEGLEHPRQRRRFVEGRDGSTWMSQEVSLKG